MLKPNFWHIIISVTYKVFYVVKESARVGIYSTNSIVHSSTEGFDLSAFLRILENRFLILNNHRSEKSYSSIVRSFSFGVLQYFTWEVQKYNE